MKRRAIDRGLAFWFLAIATAVCGADPPAATPALSQGPPSPSGTNAPGPKIHFETLVYELGEAKSGEVVKHTYVFTIAGD